MQRPLSVPDHWDVAADIVVVGFGAAGMAAAVTAHDLGAKIVIVEKAPEGQEERLVFGRIAGREAVAQTAWE